MGLFRLEVAMGNLGVIETRGWGMTTEKEHPDQYPDASSYGGSRLRHANTDHLTHLKQHILITLLVLPYLLIILLPYFFKQLIKSFYAATYNTFKKPLINTLLGGQLNYFLKQLIAILFQQLISIPLGIK